MDKSLKVGDPLLLYGLFKKNCNMKTWEILKIFEDI